MRLILFFPFFFFCTIRCSIVRKLLENHLSENGIFFILLDIKLNSKKEKKIENSNFHILFF